MLRIHRGDRAMETNLLYGGLKNHFFLNTLPGVSKDSEFLDYFIVDLLKVLCGSTSEDPLVECYPLTDRNMQNTV